jgi:hypothetical protein
VTQIWGYGGEMGLEIARERDRLSSSSRKTSNLVGIR